MNTEKNVKLPGWYRSGEALIREMKETRLPEGMLAVWYLGQAGIAVRAGEVLFGIDLYLRDSAARLLPRPFAPEDAGDLFDYVLCTHNHEDHLDEVTVRGIAAAGSRTRFVVPAPWAGLTESLGIAAERIISARAWEKQELDGAVLIPTPASHEEFEYDAEGNLTCLGYILQMKGGSLYHSGDTIEWETMARDLAPYAPEIMCLPINGSDWKRKHRNIIGNLDAREAADLADTCGADILIPTHFDMFAGNGENPAHLADYMFLDHKGHKFHIMAPGERFLYLRSV